ncbi:MAG: hypothetical protein BWY52_03288 [Chloroflexi bacterium ADurb.Bin325]|nr:MAG: hypothetical protein BWY52_03288 [Chloroflexi bacterium ADurb.Bin325]
MGIMGASLAARPRTRRGRRGSRARGRLWLVLLCAAILLLTPSDGYLGAARADFLISRAVGGEQFRLVAWEMQAIGQKAGDLFARPGAELAPAAQSALVMAYSDGLGRMDRLQREIERVYADPAEVDPQAAAAPLLAELTALRAQQEARRPAAEWILEHQVAAVLADEGLTVAGRVWPPVLFQFTESPNYLIVSPRDHILVERGVYLDPTMDVAQMERIEDAVQADLDRSALVDGTGGFSSYPTMVLAYADLAWVIDTIAHEWTHTYLMFRPLGWRYSSSRAMRTLNETVASIVGAEIAQRVIERYYPERLNPADWPRPLSMRRGWLHREVVEPDFQFGEFMRKTRLEVDRLLAAGEVEQAEAYMAAQREILVARGYVIRKLNQAYFAFHGSYAVGPAATDPLGAKLRALLRRSATLADFLHTVARFVDPADLDAALAWHTP